MLRIALPGAWRLAAPYLHRSGRRLIRASFARLRAELEDTAASVV